MNEIGNEMVNVYWQDWGQPHVSSVRNPSEELARKSLNMSYNKKKPLQCFL